MGEPAHSFRIIFSAAAFASASDWKSSGVTMLAVVLPLTNELDCLIGVIDARQHPGRRSKVTIENWESSVKIALGSFRL